MTWSEATGRWISTLMGPSLFAIIISATFALGLPILIHLSLYRARRAPGLPKFLLVGPSGSGKTALATYFERGHHAATHTSQVALQLEATLPIDVAPASSKYRLVNDPTAHTQNRCLFIDTPGHGKLRSIAIDQLIQLENLNGIIAVVDAADLSEAGPEHGVEGGLRETSEYLYEILLMLQRRHAKNRSSRSAKPIAVLIAANKMDLFTALPTPLVKSSLERGIAEVRDSRARGLLDSGIKTHSMSDSRDDGDWLGELDEKFRFSHMSEAGISVDIVGGHVTGLDGADARGWWQWIAAQM